MCDLLSVCYWCEGQTHLDQHHVLLGTLHVQDLGGLLSHRWCLSDWLQLSATGSTDHWLLLHSQGLSCGAELLQNCEREQRSTRSTLQWCARGKVPSVPEHARMQACVGLLKRARTASLTMQLCGHTTAFGGSSAALHRPFFGPSAPRVFTASAPVRAQAAAAPAVAETPDKRPPSAYNLFVKAKLPALKASDPSVRLADMGKHWKAASPSERSGCGDANNMRTTCECCLDLACQSA